MTKQEMLDALTQIGTCEDEIERRGLIATLTESATADYDEMDNLRTQNEELTTTVEETRKANMDLFLQVTASKGGKPDDSGIEEPPKKREFKDLFNEKGEIK